MFSRLASKRAASPENAQPQPDRHSPLPTRDGGKEYQAIQDLSGAVEELRSPFQQLREQLAQAVVGQHGLIDSLLLSLLAGGHLLIEGMPGLAKTTAVAALAKGIHGTFQRIAFTPDLLPADLIGTQIYRPQTHRFDAIQGPLFANVVLCDEVNRAPAKVQSALLEAMQEHQVTIGEETFALPDPFLVLATQNPIDQEGTYPLPEAQLDRFMMKALVSPPGKADELQILDRMARTDARLSVEPVLESDQLRSARQLLNEIYLDPRISEFIVDLVIATREPPDSRAALADWIEHGASPRATISLALIAKAAAFLDGRGYVVPTDVSLHAAAVLRHRILLSFEAEAAEVTTDQVVAELLAAVSVPN